MGHPGLGTWDGHRILRLFSSIGTGHLTSHALLPLHLVLAARYGAELGSRMPKARRSGLSLTPVSTVVCPLARDEVLDAVDLCGTNRPRTGRLRRYRTTGPPRRRDEQHSLAGEDGVEHRALGLREDQHRLDDTGRLGRGDELVRDEGETAAARSWTRGAGGGEQAIPHSPWALPRKIAHPQHHLGNLGVRVVLVDRTVSSFVTFAFHHSIK